MTIEVKAPSHTAGITGIPGTSEESIGNIVLNISNNEPAHPSK